MDIGFDKPFFQQGELVHPIGHVLMIYAAYVVAESRQPLTQGDDGRRRGPAAPPGIGGDRGPAGSLLWRHCRPSGPTGGGGRGSIEGHAAILRDCITHAMPQKVQKHGDDVPFAAPFRPFAPFPVPFRA